MDLKFMFSWQIWLFGFSWGQLSPMLDLRYVSLSLGPVCCMIEWPTQKEVQ